ncbi:hypothetical protein C8E03_101454 [Lachnotalea glycerini]|uniref:Uncharacterized protein n=1 Tax=Lachnotalea glycerini TaxID=1763509 RepID=A0A318EXQ0_9FIRM|nr:hypothetical protein C8E03_101454 [Lachnotalea glycerini]
MIRMNHKVKQNCLLKLNSSPYCLEYTDIITLHFMKCVD